MPDVPARVTFLFGAGASADFDAPLMKDFWWSAQRVAKGEVKADTALLTVAEWRQRKLGEGSLAPPDEERNALSPQADNLEEMLCLADLEAQFHDAGSSDVSRAIEKLASYVYDVAAFKHIQAARDRWRNGKDPVTGYEKLLRMLRSLIVQEKPLWNYGCSFITMNYDVCLDVLLAHSNPEFRGREEWAPYPDIPQGFAYVNWPLYWLGRHDDEVRQLSNPRLLKLHGSVNWGVCTDAACDAPIRQFPLTRWVQGTDEAVAIGSELHSTRCSYHPHGAREPATHRPYLVPPTWKHSQFRYGLRRVWMKAHADLVSAKKIVIIGHSLPPSDAYLRYFLRSALTKNADCEVMVVDCGNGFRSYMDFLKGFFKRKVVSKRQEFAESVDEIRGFVDSL